MADVQWSWDLGGQLEVLVVIPGSLRSARGDVVMGYEVTITTQGPLWPS